MQSVERCTHIEEVMGSNLPFSIVDIKIDKIVQISARIDHFSLSILIVRIRTKFLFLQKDLARNSRLILIGKLLLKMPNGQKTFKNKI